MYAGKCGILRAWFREAIASDTPLALIKTRRGDVRNSKEEIFIENLASSKFWDNS